MELKHYENLDNLNPFESFNRTAYGIETPQTPLRPDPSQNLLIAPLMELKRLIAI